MITIPRPLNAEEVENGIAALLRLVDVAHGCTSQPRIAARFLLSIFDGDRFPFDLTDFHCLDAHIFSDCLIVLRLDVRGGGSKGLPLRR